MKGDEAEQAKADSLMYGQQLSRERPIHLDQRRQLSDEEQVHAITMSVGLQNSQNRLRQEEGIEGVFAGHRYDSHCLGHVARPIRIFGRVTPRQAEQCHDPDSQADRSMKLQKGRMGGMRRGEIDGKCEYKYAQHEARSQPMHQSRGQIKDPSIGTADRAHRSELLESIGTPYFPNAEDRHRAKISDSLL